MVINYATKKILNGEKCTLYGVNGDYTFKDKKVNGLQINNWSDMYDYLITQNEKPEIMFYGNKLEPQEIESGYVSYGTLAKCGNLVQSHNTALINELYEQGFGYNEETEDYDEIVQVFIIDIHLKEVINRFMPDDYVTWSDITGAYIWGITHWGTSWNYVNAFSIKDLLVNKEI